MEGELIMRLVLTVACIAIAALQVNAQTKDVPEAARREIARRGNMVELTGSIRGGLMAAALAPPADDSCKWYVTLVGKPGEADFEYMRTMIATNKEEHLLAWIDAADAAHSTTHYHTRSIDDVTQRDWLAGLKPAIDRYGLPMVVVQPPRNGQFGKPETIVKGIHGRHTARELADLLRDGVITYVRTLENPIQIGHQADERTSIGVPPPFNVAPQPPAVPAQQNPIPHAQVPIDWPPSMPSALSIEQIQQACPGASPEFVLNALSSKESNAELLKLKWLIHQKEQAPREIIPENPTLSPAPRESQGSTLWPIGLGLGLGTLAAMVMIGAGILIARLVAARGEKQDTTKYSPPRYLNPKDNQEYFQFSPPATSAAPNWKPPATSAAPNG